jgi:protein-S-isoprenylcysteine O-methyltransferase Ste14
MWKWVVFVLGSLALFYVSRVALKKPMSHGFYRFFAWELMLALLLLNVSHWFSNWSHWYQVISWFLLFVCLIPLIFGIRSLSTRGRPNERQRSEPELLGFERTTRLVTDGIYRYIRHPLYSSLFILNWGIFFKDPSWIAAVLAFGASLLLLATARADEAECTQTFGADYRQYMQHTRMFIPYLF